MMTPDSIREMFNGYRISRILLSAYELDFFTVLATEGMTADQLSDRCGTGVRSTEMMLNALSALKLLIKKEGIFYNTSESLRYLDRNSEDYLSGIHHSISLWKSWSTLTEAVRKGHRVAWMDDEKQGQEWLVPFIEAMHDRARRSARAVVAQLPLTGIHKVLDLGGGPGTYAMEIARQNPHITAFVFDLPEVTPLTEKYIDREGLAGRVRTLSGNFMEDDIGSGYDLIFVSAIIHSYSPEENISLIKKCEQAARPDGVIVIQDYIMDEDRTSPVEGALFAINMLVNTDSGSTYTESEVAGWMRQVGWSDIKLMESANRTAQMVGRKQPAACPDE
jgi:cyclopropane fatty-acyl-phospholipid synthase-like methyltransferase